MILSNFNNAAKSGPFTLLQSQIIANTSLNVPVINRYKKHHSYSDIVAAYTVPTYLFLPSCSIQPIISKEKPHVNYKSSQYTGLQTLCVLMLVGPLLSCGVIHRFLHTQKKTRYFLQHMLQSGRVQRQDLVEERRLKQTSCIDLHKQTTGGHTWMARRLNAKNPT